MKITHNKVGQNLNLIDGVKQDKAGAVKDAKTSGGVQTTSSALEGGSAGSASQVAVSDRAQEAKRIKDLAKAAPDVDAAKVEKFRALIDGGNYKVDAKAVADRMVDEHLETEF